MPSKGGPATPSEYGLAMSSESGLTMLSGDGPAMLSQDGGASGPANVSASVGWMKVGDRRLNRDDGLQ